MGKTRFYIRQIMCLPIYLYRLFISPVIGPCCRFYPSCSQYAIDAILHRGIFVGSYLILRRLTRCHPGCKGGYDPVHLTKEK